MVLLASRCWARGGQRVQDRQRGGLEAPGSDLRLTLAACTTDGRTHVPQTAGAGGVVKASFFFCFCVFSSFFGFLVALKGGVTGSFDRPAVVLFRFLAGPFDLFFGFTTKPTEDYKPMLSKRSRRDSEVNRL